MIFSLECPVALRILFLGIFLRVSIDKTGAIVDEDDVTQGNENVEGGQGGTTPTTNGENSEP